MAFFVCILASEPNGTLYIGMTDDLVKRVWQHRNDFIPLKKWNRAWKLALIEQENPSWRDLWTELSAP